MRFGAKVAVIIPALNEERSIGQALSAIPAWVDDVIVADNGSSDRTAEVARSRGARVVTEPRRGYGAACLAGIAALGDPDVVVFLDGDFSDYPEDMGRLVDPILRGEADLVAGSRILGEREPGSLTPQARFGNWLACNLIRLFWGARYTDLGPFRAIHAATLKDLQMRDLDYGWMVEMQIKATRAGYRVEEVPVRYRRRIGKSKISGTIKGVIGAGVKILLTIFKLALDLRGGRDRATDERLIIFTRYPEPGKTKTRLIPALGPEGAAELQRSMTEDTLNNARRLKTRRPVSLELRYEGGNKTLMQEWLGEHLTFRAQGGGDLGARMKRAFRDAFRAGARRIVIIGTDCPDLNSELLEAAFDALQRSDVVIGPANDGGYYLIGLRRPLPHLFDGIRWGSEEVLEQTLQRVREVEIHLSLLAWLSDVDRPEDLALYEQRKADHSAEALSNGYLYHHPRPQ